MAIIACEICGYKFSDKAPSCPKCMSIQSITNSSQFNFKTASPAQLKNKYKKIAKESGDIQWFTKKELKYLPEILSDGEDVIAFCSGVMDGNTWLIVLSDRRIIFIDKGMMWGLKQSTIDLAKINSVSCSTGLLMGNITITDGAVSRQIKNVLKETVKPFTNKIQAQLELLQQPRGEAARASLDDPYAKLERLAQLKASGVLTSDEFDAQKAKILNGIG